MGAIKAVFRSWDNLANVYRRDNDIPLLMGYCCKRTVYGIW